MAQTDMPSGFDVFDDPEVVKLLAHPTRIRILIAAGRAPVSAKELGEQFDEPVDRVSYHMRTLAKAGLVRAVRRTRRRGATETHYAATAKFDFSEEVLDAAPPEVRAMLAKNQWAMIAQDVTHEIDRGASADEDFVVARAHFTVSPEGRERLRDEVWAFYLRLAELEKELRVDADDDDAAELNVVLGLYRGEMKHARNGSGYLMREREGEEPPPPIPD